MTDMVDLPAIWISATDEVAEGITSAQQRAYLRLTRLFALVEERWTNGWRSCVRRASSPWARSAAFA